MIEIKNRWTGAVLYRAENADTIKQAAEDAVNAKANLSAANLRGANLSGANLSGANLRGANLSAANLSDANLRGADLSGADLRGANLRCADLRAANLRCASLRGASLSGASLSCAEKLDGALSVTGLHWPVLVFWRRDTTASLQIGCQRHAVEEWAAFDDDAISEMDSNALAFWAEWKTPLLALAKFHPKPESE